MKCDCLVFLCVISIVNSESSGRKHKRGFLTNAFYNQNGNNIEYRPFYSPDLWGASSYNHADTAPIFTQLSSNQINTELQSDEQPNQNQYDVINEDTPDHTMSVEQPFQANSEYNREHDNQLYSITTQHNSQPYEEHTEVNNFQMFQSHSPGEQTRPVDHFHSVEHTVPNENSTPNLHTKPVTYADVPTTYQNNFPSLIQFENPTTENPYQGEVGYPPNIESPTKIGIPINHIQFLTESDLEQYNQYGQLVGANMHVADYPVDEVNQPIELVQHVPYDQSYHPITTSHSPPPTPPTLSLTTHAPVSSATGPLSYEQYSITTSHPATTPTTLSYAPQSPAAPFATHPPTLALSTHPPTSSLSTHPPTFSLLAHSPPATFSAHPPTSTLSTHTPTSNSFQHTPIPFRQSAPAPPAPNHPYPISQPIIIQMPMPMPIHRPLPVAVYKPYFVPHSKPIRTTVYHKPSNHNGKFPQKITFTARPIKSSSASAETLDLGTIASITHSLSKSVANRRSASKPQTYSVSTISTSWD